MIRIYIYELIIQIRKRYIFVLIVQKQRQRNEWKVRIKTHIYTEENKKKNLILNSNT
jgi:hypothetical protein